MGVQAHSRHPGQEVFPSLRRYVGHDPNVPQKTELRNDGFPFLRLPGKRKTVLLGL
jgi:hypothetical protein